MTLDTRDRNTIALAALRIFVGMLFLIFGDYKVFGAEFIWGGGFQLLDQPVSRGRCSPVYDSSTSEIRITARHSHSPFSWPMESWLSVSRSFSAFSSVRPASADSSIC